MFCPELTHLFTALINIMPHLTKGSTWAALRNPAFRNLWLASLLSGTCVAAHDTAATWLMNRLTVSPLLISLMSTVAALPFFLLTLPAGAIADVVDRKKLLWVMNLWLATPRGFGAFKCLPGRDGGAVLERIFTCSATAHQERTRDYSNG